MVPRACPLSAQKAVPGGSRVQGYVVRPWLKKQIKKNTSQCGCSDEGTEEKREAAVRPVQVPSRSAESRGSPGVLGRSGFCVEQGSLTVVS